MRKRLAITILAVCTAAGAFGTPSPAHAGGWAVTTLDAFAAPEPGATVDVSLTIRQHGVTPVDVDGVEIVVTAADGTASRFPAVSAGAVGRYTAAVSFPAAGRYDWEVIQGWFGPQSLGSIDVGDGPSVVGATPRWLLAMRLALPALAGGFGVLALLELRRPTRRRPATV
jgi:hypothetical protein